MTGVGRQDARLAAAAADGEQGFMLLGLIVAMAIILLFLGVAASDAAFSLRRDKELESARRADQYYRAIRLFYKKNGHYPGSVEQLENTNKVRYLRQKYVDPLTGTDYRLIVVGQNKTTPKGFFGEPLGGIGSPGPGSVGGAQTPGGAGGTPVGGVNGGTGASAGPGATGSTSANGTGTIVGGTAVTGTATASASTGTATASASTGTAAAGTAATGSAADGSSPGTTPIGNSPGGPGGATATGPIMGVGSSATGPSILTVNEQTSYETWEVLYDPRVEQLSLAAALNGGLSMGNGGLGPNDGHPASFSPPSQ